MFNNILNEANTQFETHEIYNGGETEIYSTNYVGNRNQILNIKKIIEKYAIIKSLKFNGEKL